jgi:hypothetical protein
MQGLLPGSVSKYCLQQSPIPVVVVRPSAKREKKKRKRMADPTRRSYNSIIQLSEKRGSSFFNSQVKFDGTDNEQSIPVEDERAAVAEAVGLPRRFRGLEQRTEYEKEHDLKQTHSKESEISSKSGGGGGSGGGGVDEPVGTELKPQGVPAVAAADVENAVVMKSPLIGDYDSPSSESDSNSENEERQNRFVDGRQGEKVETPESSPPQNSQPGLPSIEGHDSLEDNIPPYTTSAPLSPAGDASGSTSDLQPHE